MTFSMSPTYEQERGPEVPSFQRYADRIVTEFSVLLESDADECAIQKFLEQNPSMVPGARTPGAISGHGPLHNALISQPPLHGFNSRVPDFMWLSKHSGAWYPAMIEVERPDKKIFTAAGVPTSDFNQAKNQLVQWKVWLNTPANVQLFMDHYGVDSQIRTFRNMELHFVLIYGRRAEVDRNPKLSKQRGMLLSMPEELLSFDRLAADRDLCDAVTVKASGNGRFAVIAVPETFFLSPHNAHNLLVYDGLEEAIDANHRISVERASFLKRRIPYWRSWAEHGKKGIIGPGFKE